MNCKIRRWELSDARDLATALSNKKIQDNLRDGLPYPYTEKDGKEFISTMLAANENDTFAFAITVNGKVIGSIGAFRQTNIHNKTAELGYYIAEEYWGKGIMTEAVKQPCDYVFSNTDNIGDLIRYCHCQTDKRKEKQKEIIHIGIIGHLLFDFTLVQTPFITFMATKNVLLSTDKGAFFE